MSKKYFNTENIKVSDYPKDYIPKDADMFTSVDMSNGEDHTCVCNSIYIDGVMIIQNVHFYDNKGKLVCQ